MNKIGLFYAPMGGSVEQVALKVSEKIGREKNSLVCIHNPTENDKTNFLSFDKLILGISTVGRDSWDSNYKKVGWDIFIPMLENVNLKGKTIALFGLGNHLLYPDNFADSLGVLAKFLIKNGAKLVGDVSADAYEFSDSAAVSNGRFYGVVLDQDNDSELTDDRLLNWLNTIKNDLGF